jgi:toxin ParE1/3/4
MSYLNSDGRSYTLLLTDLAADDLSDIYFYGLEHWDEIQADSYQQKLISALEELQKNPYKGKQHRQLPVGYNSFQIGRHLIIYRIEEITIYVLRILGERMM